MEDYILQIVIAVNYILIALLFIVYVLGGLLYIYRGIKQRNLEVVLLALIGLLVLTVSIGNFEENINIIFYIVIGVLFFTLIFKMYFGEIIIKGSLKDRLTVIIGLLILLIILIFSKHIRLPDFFDYIPTF